MPRETFPIIKKHRTDDKAISDWLAEHGKKERGRGLMPGPLQAKVEQTCDNLESLGDNEDDALGSVCKTAITVIDDLREVIENSRRVINRLKLNLGHADHVFKCCCQCGPGDKCCARCTRRFTFKQAIEQAKAMIKVIDNAL